MDSSQDTDSKSLDEILDYEYTPLHDPKNEIRLLELRPPFECGPIHARLITYKITEATVYVAVSYAWGDGKPDKEIYLDSSDLNAPPGIPNVRPRQKRRLMITTNVDTALRSMFKGGNSKFLVWIDSICINQSDSAEKGPQVGHMDRVYRNAEVVSAWLGDKSEDSSLAIDLIRLYVDHYDKSCLGLRPDEKITDSLYKEITASFILKHSTLSKQWRAVSRLFRRPWWKRRWIVPPYERTMLNSLQQEVIMAKTLYLFCGSKPISWDTLFILGFALFESILKGYADWDSDSILVYQSLDTCRHIVQRGESSMLTLEVLLHCFSSTICGNPKDTIYSFLAIAGDVDRSWSPDYSEKTSYGDVQLQAFRHIFEARKTLDLLSLCWRSVKCIQFPSWLPDFVACDAKFSDLEALDKRAFKLRPASLSTFGIFNVFGRGDPYRAAGRTLPSYSISQALLHWDTKVLTKAKVAYSAETDPIGVASLPKKGELIPGYLLQTLGYCVDTICDVSEETSTYNASGPFVQNPTGNPHNKIRIPEQWLHMAFCGTPEPCSIAELPLCQVPAVRETKLFPENFWRTMVGNRRIVNGYTQRTTLAPSEWGRAISSVYFNVSLSRGGSVDHHTLTAIIMSHEVTHEYRSFATTKRSYGFVPRSAMKGDLIYIINGCSVPLVLRPEAFEIDGVPGFTLLGDCYIDGIMEGEEMTRLEAVKLPPKDVFIA